MRRWDCGGRIVGGVIMLYSPLVLIGLSTMGGMELYYALKGR